MTTNDPYGYYQVPPPGYLPPGYPPPGWTPPTRAPQRSRWSRDRRALLGGFAAGALASALVFGGLAATHGGSTSIAGAGSVTQLPSGGSSNPFPTFPNNLFPGGNSGSGSSSGSVTPANAKQQVGIVTVVSVLKYQN